MQEVHARSGVPGASGATVAVPARGAAPGTERKLTLPGRFEAVLLLAYPFAVYLGLTRFGTGATALLLLGLGVLRIVPVLASASHAASRLAFLHAGPAALAAAGLVALAAAVFVTGDGRAALALPVFVNLGLLALFARSLRGESVVEAIARRIDGELSPERRAYCRTVTRVWCGFFFANAAVVAGLALAAPVSWWTAYTGIISYALMGALFLAEYGTRRRRFPRRQEPRREWNAVAEKGTVLGIRFLWLVCRVLGRPAVRVVVRLVALYYVVVDPELRRVSREFQHRLGLPGRFPDVYRHVLRFSFCIVDRLFLLSGRSELFEFETHGDDELQAVLRQGRGAILVSAHLGSFEALRAAAVEHEYPLSIVGSFENAERINAVLGTLAPDLASRVIHVDPAGVGHMMKIRERVRAGGLVGFLGDRMAPGAEGVRVRFLGAEVEFPTGAFAVAAALSCPVFLVFSVSRGANRYIIHAERRDQAQGGSRADRAKRLEAEVQHFASRLEAHVRAAPDNWFNFFDFFVAPDPDLNPGAIDRSAE